MANELANPWLPDQWNVTEQHRIIRTRGKEEADKLAAMAGSYVGAPAPNRPGIAKQYTIVKPNRPTEIDQNRDVRTKGAHAPDDGDVLTFDTSVLPAPGQWVPKPPTGGGMNAEQVRDTIGATLTDTATVDLNYDDALDQITAQTIPAGILAQLLTVDGTGSGLDADLLDGLHAAAFALVGHDHDAVYLRLDTTNDPLSGDLDFGGNDAQNLDAVIGGGGTAGILNLAADDGGVMPSGSSRSINVDSTFTQNNSGNWSGLRSLAGSTPYVVDATDAAAKMQGYEFGAEAVSSILIQNANVNPVELFIFANFQTYKATQAATQQLVLTGSFLDQPSLSVEDGGEIFGIYYGYQSAPAFIGDHASTGAMGLAHFTSSLVNVTTDWNIFERRGFVMKRAILNGGTVGVETGIWLEGFVGTGDRITLHSLDSSAWMQHAGKARFGADTAPSATLDVTGTGAFSGVVTSTVSTGTAPFTIASTTLNTNLNADLLDGFHAASFQPIDATLTALAALADAAGVLTNDGAGNLSWSASSGYTDEQAQDAIGTILVDSSTIDFTYNDGVPSITASVIQSAIDHGSIGGLGDDDHAQYALLAGRAGGQSLKGGTAAGDDLTLVATAGVGAGSEQILFKGGNNGATTFATLDSGGMDINGVLTITDAGDTVTVTPDSGGLASIIATTLSRMRFSASASSLNLTNGDFSTGGDNDITLGGASNRWKAIFVGTTTSTFDGILQFNERVELRNAKELRFYESGSGNYSQFKATSQTADVTYTLPPADASFSKQYLASDGAGALTWGTINWANSKMDHDDGDDSVASGSNVTLASSTVSTPSVASTADMWGCCCITNSSGGGRTYTAGLYLDGALVGESVLQTIPNNSSATIFLMRSTAISAATSHTVDIRVLSSNATGTQTAINSAVAIATRISS